MAAAQPAIDAAAVKPRPGARLFDFYRCAACLCACVRWASCAVGRAIAGSAGYRALQGRQRPPCATVMAPSAHQHCASRSAVPLHCCMYCLPQELAAGAQQHRSLPASQPAVGHLRWVARRVARRVGYLAVWLGGRLAGCSLHAFYNELQAGGRAGGQAGRQALALHHPHRPCPALLCPALQPTTCTWCTRTRCSTGTASPKIRRQ